MNKTVLITGASQGIGAAIAIKFASEGYNVAINCRSEQDVLSGGNDVADKCAAYGVTAQCFIADVSSFTDCETMVKSVRATFGTIDVLVNNAGITKDGLLARMSEDQFDIVTNVNYKGVFNMIRHVSGVMIKQRGGRIINLSSVAGLHGNAGQMNYSASKAGVIGMTLTAAKELGARGITVNAVAPGFIETPMTDVLDEKVKQVAKENISLKRFGTVEEVASTICFLASEGASYITGQVIAIDGGMIM